MSTHSGRVSSRKLTIVGNWKMHTHAAEAIRLAKAIVIGFELLSTEGVNGALLGAASLDADQFLSVIRTATRVKKPETDLLIV